MTKILLIDDDNAYRTIVKKWLERAGYEITEAIDGMTGLKLYGQNKYDLVITDLFMPGIDGVQVIKRLKAEFISPKIIAMTGVSSEGRTEYLLKLATDCGACAVYKKTTHINYLLSEVKFLL